MKYWLCTRSIQKKKKKAKKTHLLIIVPGDKRREMRLHQKNRHSHSSTHTHQHWSLRKSALAQQDNLPKGLQVIAPCTQTLQYTAEGISNFLSLRTNVYIARFHEICKISARRLKHGGNANFTRTAFDFTALERRVGPHAMTEGDSSACPATNPSTEGLEGRLRG